MYEDVELSLSDSPFLFCCFCQFVLSCLVASMSLASRRDTEVVPTLRDRGFSSGLASGTGRRRTDGRFSPAKALSAARDALGWVLNIRVEFLPLLVPLLGFLFPTYF